MLLTSLFLGTIGGVCVVRWDVGVVAQVQWYNDLASFASSRSLLLIR